MTENMTPDTLLIVIIGVSVVSGIITLGFRIIWDWFQKKKNGKGDTENKSTAMSLKEIHEYISEHQSDETKALREQVTLLQTNDVDHLKEGQKEIKTEITNIWTAINGNKSDIKELTGKVGELKGKTNGRKTNG